MRIEVKNKAIEPFEKVMYNLASSSDLSQTDEDGIVTIDLHEDSLMTRNPMRKLEMSPIDDEKRVMPMAGMKGMFFPFKFNQKSIHILYGFSGAFFLLVLPFMISLIVMSTRYQALLNRSSPGGQGGEDLWMQFSATSSIGAVATDNEICSHVGVDILKQGGNAVDAAVAAALCVGVLNPSSSGLGGGCFILEYDNNTQSSTFYDSRETAPSAATSSMFDNNPTLSVNGGLAVAVLGELKGLYEVHTAKGLLSWKRVVSPAVALAKEWTLSTHMGNVLNDDAKKYLESGEYPELSRIFMNNGVIKQAGDTVHQPELANTLEGIAEYGSDYLYDTMAASIANDIQAAGGIVTEADIRAYTVKVHNPVQIDVLGHKLISASGSSSGGAVLAGIVNFMEGYLQPAASAGHVYDHRLVEAMKHGFAIRLSLGDPDFVNTTGPIGALLNKTYMAELRGLTQDTEVLDVNAYGGMYNLNSVGRRLLSDDHGTMHLSVVDRFGNAVGLTSTINTDFGSKVVSPSTGIVFNNQMDDFSNANAANYYGLHPSSYNYPEPGKRPLSSMSPTMLLSKEGMVRLVGGASGGPRIITATVQVLLNYMVRGMDGLLDALKFPRLHSQLVPETVYVENHELVSGLAIVTGQETYSALSKRGHNITEWGKSMGVSQYVAIDPDTLELCACSDPRKDGKPAGV